MDVGVDINKTIDEIWQYFRDCAIGVDGKKAVYFACNILDNDWKQRQMYNVFLLEHFFLKAKVFNQSVINHKDMWVEQMIPYLIYNSSIKEDSHKASILRRLYEFRVQLFSAMRNMPRLRPLPPRAAVGDNCSLLESAVDRLCNLYDRIYPTT